MGPSSRKPVRNRLVAPAVGLFLASTPVASWANEVIRRFGAITDGWANTNVEAGITLTAQHANRRGIDSEWLGSIDLVAEMPLGPGKWTLYVEGSASPRRSGVSALFPDANADAGTAFDGDGAGRFQVSALNYTWLFHTGNLTAGLLDPAAPLDNSDVANDETQQFLGAALVNNPTIGFPDYALGAVYHRDAADGDPGFTLVLTGSHGLGDNPDASYAELFDVGERGKGVFVAGEMSWRSPKRTLRLGAWTNTSDEHERLDAVGETDRNYGFYLTVDQRMLGGDWNLRLGAANAAVSEAANFAALAAQYPLASKATLGVGLARTGISRYASADVRHALQGEVYTRVDISSTLHLTPSIQWLRQDVSEVGADSANDDVFVYGLRAGFVF
jgi:hypothetical protein